MTFHWIHNPQPQGSSVPYKCGNRDGIGVTNRADVTCSDCLTLMGSDPRSPLQTPPEMNEDGDGVFMFYSPFDPEVGMEVVPQTTGNVEITIGEHYFTLSHLDRADMIRALLHDFHYSPEKDGPHDN